LSLSGPSSYPTTQASSNTVEYAGKTISDKSDDGLNTARDSTHNAHNSSAYAGEDVCPTMMIIEVKMILKLASNLLYKRIYTPY